MKGLDLSKFQKKEHKEGHTILLHPDGHEIRIAHSALSPKMLKDLTSLPMAEGGKVQSDADKITASFNSLMPSGAAEHPAPKPASPQQSQPSPQQPTTASPPQPDQYAGGGKVAMYAGGTQQVSPQDATADNSSWQPDPPAAMPIGSALGAAVGNSATPAVAASQPDQAMPAGNPDESVAPDAPSLTDQKAGVYNFLNQEDANTAHDLAMGHIQPETYKDLFAKKDTLGKIGTLFGLLAGGIGSGLTHQPSAIVEMMHQQIQNDLDAQNKSSANAMTFLKAAQNDPVLRATARETGANADVLAQQKAYLDQANTTYHDLMLKVQKMPEGPQKQAAMQAAMLVGQIMGNKLNNAKDLAAATAGSIAPSQGVPQAAPAAQPGQKQGSIQSLLHPGAENTFKGLALNPLAKADYGEVADQYKSASQADKALKNLDANFANMSGNTSVGQHLESITEPMANTPFGVGELLHGPLKGLARATDTGEKYYSGQSGILADLRAAFPNIGEGEISKLIQANSPQRGDSPEILKQKKESIEGFIKRSVPTTMLKKYRLLGE